MGMSCLYAVWIFFGICGVTCQGDSLRSALNAVDRRQRFLIENFPISYSHENPAILSYLPDPSSIGENDLPEYFSDGNNDVDRQISSSFRERIEEGRDKELEELSQRVLAGLEGDDSYENSAYRTKDPWHKYRNGFPRNDRIPTRTRKRQFYPEFGYDSIGLRKRGKYIPSEYFNEYNYLLNMNDDYPSDYIDSLDYSRRSSPYRDTDDFYNRIGANYRSNFRHIPVSKRSSEYPNISKDKKLQNQEIKTDPKVEKDLSSIFATSDKKKSIKYPKKADDGQKKKQTQTNHTNSKTESKKNDTKKEIKEISSEKPIQITKKSIDWSDYFGLDRRKKSNDDINKEWLMERYHKAVAVSKKNSEYPLQSFHHHDGVKTTKRGKEVIDNNKLEKMDQNLKVLEDEIVDDALKYTGANEGVTDPKDIREVEDGIISRLAKAYSIEKMRRALGEYKMLIDKEREKLNAETDDGNEDESFSEKKRVSVPRKQAVDSNRGEQIEDNHIKCTQENGDCDEDNYKAPIEVIEQMNYEVGGCPKIQRECNQFAPLLGEYGKIFEESCNTHQMCLICGNNNWYPAIRQCNVLFLSKVFDMCDGKTECQKELQKSVRYLMNITRNIRNNPSEECNLVCPEGADGL
ncbi:hypothetical protein WA026_010431 [Henosepilachna vigintioctopunctata]|uniref:Uncharacterized protein n=1 Tax=Henosepilachna vigintioctopunctata TaxID=420089 RepID=A0AAW1VB46_9CUCU